MEFVGKAIFLGPSLMEFVGKAMFLGPSLMEFVGKAISDHFGPRVWALGFRPQGLGLRVSALGFGP